MNYKEIAEMIARKAFEAKSDLNGEPYMWHLLRVANSLPEDSFIPAILHDLLEDFPEWNPESLVHLIPQHHVRTIETLTKGKKEPYFDYITRVSWNDEAKRIKIADLRDNLDITRFKKQLTEKDIARLQKYQKAYLFLTGEISEP